jgi:hypothetical protein
MPLVELETPPVAAYPKNPQVKEFGMRFSHSITRVYASPPENWPALGASPGYLPAEKRLR